MCWDGWNLADPGWAWLALAGLPYAAVAGWGLCSSWAALSRAVFLVGPLIL